MELKRLPAGRLLIHPILQFLLGISAYGVFALMLRGLTREELV